MPAHVDYSEDFLQELLSVRFGNKFVGLAIGIPTPPSLPGRSVSIAFSLPDQAGGTPGLNLVTANVALATLKLAPVTITSATLQEEFVTLAGSRLTGFGVRGFVGTPSPGTLNLALYIRLNAAMPSSPFRMRLAYTPSDPVNGYGETCEISVAGMRNLKPVRLSSPFPDTFATQVSSQTAFIEPFDRARTIDFRVHPDSLLIDAPTG